MPTNQNSHSKKTVESKINGHNAKNSSQLSERKEPLHLCVKISGREDLDITSDLSGKAAVGSIRTLVAKHLNLKPERILLEQEMAWNNFGNKCVVVCDANTTNNSQSRITFGDEDGHVCSPDDVEDIATRTLTEDTAIVMTVPKNRSVIRARITRPAKRVSLYVRNWSGPHFQLRPLLPHPAFVGDIRSALADEMNVDNSRIRLDRRVGIAPGGAKCFFVCPESVDPSTFGDADGIMYSKGDIKVLREEQLYFDDEIFMAVPGKKNCVEICIQHPPILLRRLLLRSPKRREIRLAPRLPDELKVSELRRLIARKLRVDSERLKMSRWIGHDRHGNPVFHVCGSADNFVDISSDDAWFEGWSGFPRQRDLKDVKCVVLGDNDDFEIRDVTLRAVIYIEIK